MKGAASPVVRVDYVPHFWFYSLFSLFLCVAAVLMAFDHFALIRSKPYPVIEVGALIFTICSVSRVAFLCSFMLEWDGRILVVRRIWGSTRCYTIDQLRGLDREVIRKLPYSGLVFSNPSLMVHTLRGSSIPIASVGAAWRRNRAVELVDALSAAMQTRTTQVSVRHTLNR
jgi:hypothetical protein